MEFKLDVYFHFGDNFIQLLTERMNVMTAQMQSLTDQVTANNQVIESAITLINGIAAQLAAVKDDPVAIQALADSLAAEDTTLAAAITANTV